MMTLKEIDDEFFDLGHLHDVVVAKNVYCSKENTLTLFVENLYAGSLEKRQSPGKVQFSGVFPTANFDFPPDGEEISEFDIECNRGTIIGKLIFKTGDIVRWTFSTVTIAEL